MRLIVPRLSRKNVSLYAELMKLDTLVEEPCGIVFRLGPNSKTPPSGRHLVF